MSTIGSTSSAYVQQAFASAIQSSGLNPTHLNLTTAASTDPTDTARLSSLARVTATLQKLQETDSEPHIGGKVSGASDAAKSQGSAQRLSQLANDLSEASQTASLVRSR
jgi:hypothetical protein